MHAELETLSLFRTAIDSSNVVLPRLHTLDLTLSTGFLDDASLSALLRSAPHLTTLRLMLCTMGQLALCDSSTLTSLRTLELSDLLTDAQQLVPGALLTFVSQCPALRVLRALRYDPAQLEAILSAVRTPLEEVHVEAYLSQGDQGPSLGSTLRRVVGFKTMANVRKWTVAIEVEYNRWSADREWRDCDWEEWEKICKQKGVEVVLDDEL